MVHMVRVLGAVRPPPASRIALHFVFIVYDVLLIDGSSHQF